MPAREFPAQATAHRPRKVGEMIRRMVGHLGAMLLALLFAADVGAADFSAERREMLEEIKQLTAATAAGTGRKALDPRILDAMARIPREAFVPPKQAASAYQSRPLSIGHGQTISQPFIVALMTELLSLKPADKVLEVGTGSGYQAAVLSLLAREVYTIEIIPELGNAAAATLRRLGFANVKSKVRQGTDDSSSASTLETASMSVLPFAKLENDRAQLQPQHHLPFGCRIRPPRPPSSASSRSRRGQ